MRPLWNERHSGGTARESDQIERIGNSKDKAPSFAAPRHIQTGKRLTPRMQAETRAIRSFPKIQIGDACRDIACINEDSMRG